MRWMNETRGRLGWVDGASTEGKERAGEKDRAPRAVDDDKRENEKRESSVPSGSEEWQAVGGMERHR